MELIVILFIRHLVGLSQHARAVAVAALTESLLVARGAAIPCAFECRCNCKMAGRF